MVSFYFPDELKVPTVDITFVVEQSVFQKNVFSWKVKVISFIESNFDFDLKRTF